MDRRRCDGERADPDHHLRRGARAYQLRVTLLWRARKLRLTTSLDTLDVVEARRRRDRLLDRLRRRADVTLLSS